MVTRTRLGLSSLALLVSFGAVACGGSDERSEAAPLGAGGAFSDTGVIGGAAGAGASSASAGSAFAATGGASYEGSTAGGAGGAYQGSAAGGAGNAPAPSTNVSLGGSQDFGYFRALLDAGQVPAIGDFDAAGFFAEHHTALPPADCGSRVCLQAMLGVMGSLTSGANCTMMQLGLNSPIVADPGQRPPLSLTVVVDVSGSMGDKIDFVQDGLGLLIDGLNDADRFALVTYEAGVEVPYPMTDVQGNRVEMRSIVEGITVGGGTNLYGGLERGFQEAAGAYDSGRQNRVILLSDGQPTSGITNEADILAMSKARNSNGIGLTTVGLGTSFNVELMRNLALQADGNFYFLENSAAVTEVFTEELSYFTVPIAFDLKLEVFTGTYYDFGVARGTPFWNDTPEGGTLEVPSVFIAHRQSASDNEAGRRGGGSALLIELMPKADDGSGVTDADVARIDMQFREPGTDAIIEESVTVNFPMAPWITPTTGYFEAADPAIVQKSFVMLNIYVGIEGAVRAFHESDDASGAIGALDALIAAVEDYNEEVQDEDIALDLVLLEDLRRVMMDSGARPPPVSNIPEDPWPAD